jgi:branched-chain amino acid transport system permease protein
MKFWISAAVILVLAFLSTLVTKNEYFFFAGYVVLQFVVLATAWNILGGYAGYVNFGTGAFFGIGAYTAVLLIKALGLPLGVQILRPTVTPPFHSYIEMLFVIGVVLAIIAVAVARYIETSWVGRGLRAIRDSEEAAECTGVPTLRLKLAACTISGALMSAAGAPLAMYQSFVEPASSFSLNYSVNALAMPLIGGTAHWFGPVLGALLLGTIQQLVTVTISSELNVLVVGVLLVFFVVAAPEGIVGLAMKLWQRFSR